jgi:D-alanine-D-alanine ligase-like ATP-grasp enzyme
VPEVIELSYDKQKTKELLISLGIRVPYGTHLSPDEAADWTLFPAIVKPSREHCSLTLTEKSVVFDAGSLREQIMLVYRELDKPAMVEDFIDENKALATWHGFGCLDYARFDFRLRDNKFYLLDINPNNDLSFDTSFALAAEAVNYSYGQMARRIVMMAAERHPVFGEKIIAKQY